MPRARSSAKNNSIADLGLAAHFYFGLSPLDFRLRALHPDLRADYVLANPPFNDSDTAPRGSAILQSRTNAQVVRKAQDNFRTAMREAQNPKQGRLTCRVWEDKDDDVRWQWREATWTTNGSPKGEHNQAHQYPSPQRGNANFAWVQHFIHHLAPQGIAGFVLVRFWFWLKSRAVRVIKSFGRATPDSFSKRRRATLFVQSRELVSFGTPHLLFSHS